MRGFLPDAGGEHLAVIDEYSYHSYNKAGVRMVGEIATLREKLKVRHSSKISALHRMHISPCWPDWFTAADHHNVSEALRGSPQWSSLCVLY